MIYHIQIYRSITGAYYALYAVVGVGMNIIAYKRLKVLVSLNYHFMHSHVYTCTQVIMNTSLVHSAEIILAVFFRICFHRKAV